jgi:hypothetical protein
MPSCFLVSTPLLHFRVKVLINAVSPKWIQVSDYLTTDQVLAVGGIQFQSEPLRKRNHLVELRMLHHATVTMSR